MFPHLLWPHPQEQACAPAQPEFFATLFVPGVLESNAPCFTDGARELICGVLPGLNRLAGTRWDFRTLLCALDSKEHIRAVAARHPRAKILVGRILNDPRHATGPF